MRPAKHEPELARDRALRKRWYRFHRYSTVELLITLLLLFVFTPFVQELPDGKTIETVLMTFVLLASLLAVGGPRRTLVGIPLAAIAVIARWIHHLRPDLLPKPYFLLIGLVFVVFVIAHLLRFVLKAPEVDHETLCGSIAAYLLIGLLWAMAFELLGQGDPHAFVFSDPGQTMDGFNAFYLSFVTLSTVGFGDIAPASRGARMLAILEAVTGLFYVTILVARLVALYSSKPTVGKEGGDAEGR